MDNDQRAKRLVWLGHGVKSSNCWRVGQGVLVTVGAASMEMDPRQCLAVVPKALQFALFLIPDGLCGTKKRDSNGLKLFGRVAVVTRAILLVYRENNLGQGSPRFQRKKSGLRKSSRDNCLLLIP